MTLIYGVLHVCGFVGLLFAVCFSCYWCYGLIVGFLDFAGVMYY